MSAVGLVVRQKVANLADARNLPRQIEAGPPQKLGVAAGFGRAHPFQGRLPREKFVHPTTHHPPVRGWFGRGRWTHRRQDGRLIEVEATTGDTEFEGEPASLALIKDVTPMLIMR